MKRAGAIIFAVITLFACQPKHAPPAVTKPRLPRLIDAAHLGTKLGADGAVSEDAASFTEGEPIYLTLKLHESPPGLQTHVIWMTAQRAPLRRELRDMNGAKVVTFALGQRLAPAHYRVEGYWGGNLVAQKEFDVVAAAKKER